MLVQSGCRWIGAAPWGTDDAHGNDVHGGAFAALDFVRHGWPRAWLGLTCFAAGFVLVRIVGGRLPDRLGGVPVAIVSLGVEAIGQLVLFLAAGPLAALAGAMLTGLGCSLVYPSMAIVVVRRVDPRLRATAIGSFSAFQDLAYATTGPLAGLLADRFGVPVAFLVGVIAAADGFVIAAADGFVIAAADGFAIAAAGGFATALSMVPARR